MSYNGVSGICYCASWVLFGAPRHPSHYDPLHSYPFYSKGPSEDWGQQTPHATHQTVRHSRVLSKDHQGYGAIKLLMLHTRRCAPAPFPPTKHQPFNSQYPPRKPCVFPTKFHSTALSLCHCPYPPPTYVRPSPIDSGPYFLRYRARPLARPARRMSHGDWSLTRTTFSATLNRRTGWLTEPATSGKWGESDSKRSLVPGTDLNPTLCLSPNPFTKIVKPK